MRGGPLIDLSKSSRGSGAPAPDARIDPAVGDGRAFFLVRACTASARVLHMRLIWICRKDPLFMRCPFVYADGHQCSGQVRQARAYGKHRFGLVDEQNIRKIRLWCSEKNDHVGAVSGFVAKERMEFYPSGDKRSPTTAWRCSRNTLQPAGLRRRSARIVEGPRPRRLQEPSTRTGLADASRDRRRAIV